MSETNWISKLKVGDKVLIDRSPARLKLSKVKKITPTGCVRLIDNDLYDLNGYKKGGKDCWSIYSSVLRPYGLKWKEQFRKEQYDNFLYSDRRQWRLLPLDEAEALVNRMKELELKGEKC